ncbi:hypothetical protein ABG067_003310 [Albugo candida]
MAKGKISASQTLKSVADVPEAPHVPSKLKSCLRKQKYDQGARLSTKLSTATTSILLEPSEAKPTIQSVRTPSSMARTSFNDFNSKHWNHSDQTQNREAAICWKEEGDIASDRQIDEYLHQLYPTPLEQDRLCLDRMHQTTRRRLCSIATISHFSNLRYLDVSNNAIHKTFGLEALKMLETLIFARNQLREIDDSLFRLTNLRHLNVSGNFIQHIPKKIAQLTRLETFNICGNNLGILKEINILSELGNLSNCSFAGNPFCALPYYREYVIHKIKGIENLDEGVVSILMRKQSHRRFNDLSFAKDQQLKSMREIYEAQQSKMLQEQANLIAENAKLRGELHLKAKLLQNKSKEWSIATNQLLQLQQELAMLNLEQPSVRLSSLEALMDSKSQASEASPEIPLESKTTALVPAKTRKRIENQAPKIDRNGSKVIKPFSFAGTSVPSYSFQVGGFNLLRLTTKRKLSVRDIEKQQSQKHAGSRATDLEMEFITLKKNEIQNEKNTVESMEAADAQTSFSVLKMDHNSPGMTSLLQSEEQKEDVEIDQEKSNNSVVKPNGKVYSYSPEENVSDINWSLRGSQNSILEEENEESLSNSSVAGLETVQARSASEKEREKSACIPFDAEVCKVNTKIDDVSAEMYDTNDGPTGCEHLQKDMVSQESLVNPSEKPREMEEVQERFSNKRYFKESNVAKALDLQSDHRIVMKGQVECFPETYCRSVSSTIGDRYGTALLAEANKAIFRASLLAKESSFDPHGEAIPCIKWDEQEIGLLRSRDTIEMDGRKLLKSPDFLALKNSLKHHITNDILDEIKFEISQWVQNDFRPKWTLAPETKVIPHFQTMNNCERRASWGNSSSSTRTTHLSTDRPACAFVEEPNDSPVDATFSEPQAKRSSPSAGEETDCNLKEHTEYEAKYRYIVNSGYNHHYRCGDVHRIHRFVKWLQTLQNAESVDPTSCSDADSSGAHLKIHLKSARNLPLNHFEAKNGDTRVTVEIADVFDIARRKLKAAADDSNKIEYQSSMKRSSSPVWDEAFDIAVPDDLQSFLHVCILHDCEVTQEKVIGEVWISLFAFLHQNQITEWFLIESPNRNDRESKGTIQNDSAICLSLQLFHSKIDRLRHAFDDAVDTFIKAGNELPEFIRANSSANETERSEDKREKVDEIRIAWNDLEPSWVLEDPFGIDLRLDDDICCPVLSTKTRSARKLSISTTVAQSNRKLESVEITENSRGENPSVRQKAVKQPNSAVAFELSMECLESSAKSDVGKLSNEYTTASTTLHVEDACDGKLRDTERSQCEATKNFPSRSNNRISKERGKSTQCFDEYSLYHPSHMMAALYVLETPKCARKNPFGTSAMRIPPNRMNASNSKQNIKQPQRRTGNLDIFKRPNVPRRRPSTTGIPERYIGLDNQTSERLKRMFGRMNNQVP